MAKLYRNRKKPYPVPADIEAWGTFTTNPPTAWLETESLCERFQAIYGETALKYVQIYKRVPENVDKNMVYISNWTGPVYFTPDKPISNVMPGEDGKFVIGRVDQDILDRLDLIISLLKKE